MACPRHGVRGEEHAMREHMHMEVLVNSEEGWNGKGGGGEAERTFPGTGSRTRTPAVVLRWKKKPNTLPAVTSAASSGDSA